MALQRWRQRLLIPISCRPRAHSVGIWGGLQRVRVPPSTPSDSLASLAPAPLHNLRRPPVGRGKRGWPDSSRASKPDMTQGPAVQRQDRPGHAPPSAAHYGRLDGPGAGPTDDPKLEVQQRSTATVLRPDASNTVRPASVGASVRPSGCPCCPFASRGRSGLTRQHSSGRLRKTSSGFIPLSEPRVRPVALHTRLARTL